MKKKKSVKFKIVVGIAGLFVLYNIIWGVYTFIKWKPYCDAITSNEKYQEERGYSITLGEHNTMDNFTYHVALPRYLSFRGNLSACQTEIAGSDRPTVDLIIFPEMSGYRIVTSLITYEHEEYDTTENGLGSIVLNEKMEFYEEPTEEEKKLYEEYYPEIKNAFEKIDEMWGIK